MAIILIIVASGMFKCGLKTSRNMITKIVFNDPV